MQSGKHGPLKENTILVLLREYVVVGCNNLSTNNLVMGCVHHYFCK